MRRCPGRALGTFGGARSAPLPVRERTLRHPRRLNCTANRLTRRRRFCLAQQTAARTAPRHVAQVLFDTNSALAAPCGCCSNPNGSYKREASDITAHLLYYIIPYHIISHHIISYPILSYHIISFYIISYYIILYYIILYYIFHIKQCSNGRHSPFLYAALAAGPFGTSRQASGTRCRHLID